MSILIFLAVLVVLILVHELGHFVVAKWTGMRVDEFGIGFPPRIFGVQKGETLYSLNALPIGGFVKIYGENSEEGGNDTPRAFTSRPKWAQALVLVAGVAMNVLLAWCIFVGVLMVGTPTAVSEADASDTAQLLVTDVLPESPAARAAIPRGAEVIGLSAGNTELATITPSAFMAFVAAHADQTLMLTYATGGAEQSVELQPVMDLEAAAGTPLIGVSLAFVETIARAPHVALYEGTIMTMTTLRDITIGISGLLADAVLLKADLSGVAGPVGIVGLVGDASAIGITTLLMFTAFISLNLAVINLLPFPALDGGRLVIVAIEAIKGSAVRPEIVGTVNLVGFGLLILLMIAVTYNDIIRLL